MASIGCRGGVGLSGSACYPSAEARTGGLPEELRLIPSKTPLRPGEWLSAWCWGARKAGTISCRGKMWFTWPIRASLSR